MPGLVEPDEGHRDSDFSSSCAASASPRSRARRYQGESELAITGHSVNADAVEKSWIETLSHSQCRSAVSCIRRAFIKKPRRGDVAHPHEFITTGEQRSSLLGREQRWVRVSRRTVAAAQGERTSGPRWRADSNPASADKPLETDRASNSRGTQHRCPYCRHLQGHAR